MGRRSLEARRTHAQVAADAAAVELAEKLGRMLRDGRRRTSQRQTTASHRAGLSQGMWSGLERGVGARLTLATWNRAAMAVDSSLQAYLSQTSAASLPRDAVHLRNQELIISTATAGGWQALPEASIDQDVGRSRSADVLLRRGLDFALFDVWDWFADVGAALRSWPRRLDAVERLAIARMVGDQALPTVSGCWVVRATQRNRQLIPDHAHVFRAALPGSARSWIAALTDRGAPMPTASALLWVTANGTRIYPARPG
jgi:hypothetical protein